MKPKVKCPFCGYYGSKTEEANTYQNDDNGTYELEQICGNNKCKKTYTVKYKLDGIERGTIKDE